MLCSFDACSCILCNIIGLESYRLLLSIMRACCYRSMKHVFLIGWSEFDIHFYHLHIWWADVYFIHMMWASANWIRWNILSHNCFIHPLEITQSKTPTVESKADLLLCNQLHWKRGCAFFASVARRMLKFGKNTQLKRQWYWGRYDSCW